MLSYLLSTLDNGRLGVSCMLHDSVFKWRVEREIIQVSLFGDTLTVTINELPVVLYVDIASLLVKKVSLDKFDYVSRVIKGSNGYEVLMVVYRDPWYDVPIVLEHPKLRLSSEYEGKSRLLLTNTIYNSFEEIKKLNAPMMVLSRGEGSRVGFNEFVVNDFAILKSGKYNVSLNYAEPFDIWNKVAMSDAGQMLPFRPKWPEFTKMYINGVEKEGLIDFEKGNYEIVCVVDCADSGIKLYEGNYNLSVCQYKLMFV